jgi:hypothetical protein
MKTLMPIYLPAPLAAPNFHNRSLEPSSPLLPLHPSKYDQQGKASPEPELHVGSPAANMHAEEKIKQTHLTYSLRKSTMASDTVLPSDFAFPWAFLQSCSATLTDRIFFILNLTFPLVVCDQHPFLATIIKGSLGDPIPILNKLTGQQQGSVAIKPVDPVPI